MSGSSSPAGQDLAGAYLRHVPAPVRALSARVSDAVLLRTFETVDAAHTARTGEPVHVPGIGSVPDANIGTVWGWLVDVVKSRHAEEWTAASDALYAEITARAAVLQGVEPAAVDWDGMPDDVADALFEGKPSALDIAVAVLRAHAGVSA